ncbi:MULTISPECIES: hypothetical protein [Bradyrhizobium]|jgi:hypothetical protein|uniref:hypothetical protein n=1 Tax=Bradyrhizobium TaxID=374 RepID=UPI001449C7C8|nr:MULTISPECIES: hypothetical protein [Bradyrhizobium]MCP1930581.1 hypothetical protein [Bradyrhizobium elkanii]MCS3518005.1 hypothetical protein [Bradyrhizobium elkanii]MCS3578801.1 hypothetical protein [Bradyrhizobium elkanii]MCS3690585.1 hypothetical protein [Bradyrhizobium elkanii]MCS3721674.1 hypothetical protein [Bradyrhizobium elkanii]
MPELGRVLFVVKAEPAKVELAAISWSRIEPRLQGASKAARLDNLPVEPSAPHGPTYADEPHITGDSPVNNPNGPLEEKLSLVGEAVISTPHQAARQFRKITKASASTTSQIAGAYAGPVQINI